MFTEGGYFVSGLGGYFHSGLGGYFRADYTTTSDWSKTSFNILNRRFFYFFFPTLLLSAAATGASVATGNSVAADMIKGISDEAQQEVAEKQDYSISVKKDIGIQIYVVKRAEY